MWAALESVNLDTGLVLERLPSELSGGMRKRVGVARAIVGQPAILLYDEPVTGLDPVNSAAVARLIVDIRERTRVTSILVTHQLRDAFNVARTFVFREGEEFGFRRLEDKLLLAGTEFLMLREGQVHFEGSPRELESSRDPYVREFLS